MAAAAGVDRPLPKRRVRRKKMATAAVAAAAAAVARVTAAAAVVAAAAVAEAAPRRGRGVSRPRADVVGMTAGPLSGKDAVHTAAGMAPPDTRTRTHTDAHAPTDTCKCRPNARVCACAHAQPVTTAEANQGSEPLRHCLTTARCAHCSRFHCTDGPRRLWTSAREPYATLTNVRPPMQPQ